MSDPYIGEIRMVGFNFPPVGWALCNGQQLPIDQNSALFTLIGTTYGGDGQTTFNLPDLRGRFPLHWGQGPGLSPYVIGQVSGSEAITLTANQIPPHNHVPRCNSNTGDQGGPANDFWAAPAQQLYSDTAPTVSMNPNLIAQAGTPTPAPHDNMNPLQVISFIIALVGIFPPRN
jgi:microcystin-dependent protein